MTNEEFEALSNEPEWCPKCWNAAGWAVQGVAFFMGKEITRLDDYRKKLKWCQGKNCVRSW
jgi:hypothetical protein